MKSKRSPWLLLAGLLVLVGLPILGKWTRRDHGPRCALDGLKIEPLYQARVVDGKGVSHLFCCVRCARQWLVRQGDSPRAVYVTDETSGQEIDPRSACFVQSLVATHSIIRNYVHVFKSRADAAEHLRVYGGVELTGSERPFRVEESSAPVRFDSGVDTEGEVRWRPGNPPGYSAY